MYSQGSLGRQGLKVEVDGTMEVEVGVMSFEDGRRFHKPGNRGDI